MKRDLEDREISQDAEDTFWEHGGHLIFLAQAIVGRILDLEDPHKVLAWAQEVLPIGFSSLFDNPDPVLNARQTYWLARSFWNATPLPSNGFRPDPLPSPKEEDPCPCGAKNTYARCCARAMAGYDLDQMATPEMIWPLLAANYKDGYWLQAERTGKLPTDALCAVVAHYYDSELWRPLQKLMEARLAVPARCNDPLLAEPLMALCDAYEELHSTPRKMLKVLRQFLQHPTPALRSQANCRIAEHLAETGEVDQALAALEYAVAAEPDNYEVGVSELTVLAKMGAFERASERASEWRNHLKDRDDLPEGCLQGFEFFELDPKGALDHLLVADAPEEMHALVFWLGIELGERPAPRLRWRAIHADPDDELLLDAYHLVTPRNRRTLEEEWLAVSGMEKPFSINPSAGVEMQCWERSERWIPWLHEHPKALDSLTILDDLARLLDAVAEELHGRQNRWYMGVLVRGVETLSKHWPANRKGKLPWVIEENRPALRLLAAFIQSLGNDCRNPHVESTMNLYLRLNPTDNHGFRCPLVNYLLAEGRDADALARAKHYPDDMFAETRYGEVLALYRLGKLPKAEKRLQEAAQDLPLVPKYLLSERVQQPELEDGGMQIGGEDQAWFYRDDMREEWLRTDGAMEWMAERVGEGGE